MLFPLLVIMLVCFGAGMPVAFAMGVASAAVLVINGEVPLILVPNRLLAGVDSFPLMAVPFFLLAGSLMNTGGVTRRLIDFAGTLVGHIRGGLSHVAIVTNMIMAGMSGSATADAAGTGAFLIPAMEQGGYPRAYAAAVTGAASSVGPIIPPSVPFVVFGAMAGVSVGRLFLGGAIPGVLMGLYLMVACYLVAKRRNYGRARRATLSEVWTSFRRASLALLMPVIILGGILGGFVTPTEAAVIAVVYALILGVCVYRELRLRDLARILRDVGINTAVVMLIVATSTTIAWILAREQAGQALTRMALEISGQAWVILLMLNLLILIAGCFLELFVVMVIMVPVLMPLMNALGVDPVHFGVFFTLNLMIGLLTPPVGMVMYVVSTISRTPIWEFTRELPPFLIALGLALLCVTYIPSLVLWLPDHVMGVR